MKTIIALIALVGFAVNTDAQEKPLYITGVFATNDSNQKEGFITDFQSGDVITYSFSAGIGWNIRQWQNGTLSVEASIEVHPEEMRLDPYHKGSTILTDGIGGFRRNTKTAWAGGQYTNYVTEWANIYGGISIGWYSVESALFTDEHGGSRDIDIQKKSETAFRIRGGTEYMLTERFGIGIEIRSTTYTKGNKNAGVAFIGTHRF